MKTLEQIQTFLLVSELGSFVKAADKLGLSAAAIGKQIKLLEAEVNGCLFYRTTRIVTLSELGSILYQEYKSFIAMHRHIEEQIAAYNGVVRGKLSICSPVYIGETYIIPHLSEFMSLYPDLTIDIDLMDRLPDLLVENRDLIVGIREWSIDQYSARKIISSQYIYCASPEYLRHYGIPSTFDQLDEHHVIIHSNDPLGFGVKVNFTPKLLLNNTQAIINAGIQGIGIIRVFKEMVEEHIMQGALVKVLTQHEESAQPLYLFYKKGKYLQPKIRKFIDFIVHKIEHKKSST